MTFKFKYKARWWVPWWTSRVVKGSRFDATLNRMYLYLPNGGLLEIPNWTSCFCKLGPDWVLATKDQMEKEAGQSIKVSGT